MKTTLAETSAVSDFTQRTTGAYAANRPVGLVILGANFGAKIARAIAAHGGPVRVAGICDLNTEKARVLAAELEVPVYNGIEAVLADPAVEAVGVFTGPVGRGRLIERILDSGRHVMTTKPFELDPSEAARALAQLTVSGAFRRSGADASLAGRRTSRARGLAPCAHVGRLPGKGRWFVA
jgi:Oxidoreductase family, NAD-binding Rossmann fold